MQDLHQTPSAAHALAYELAWMFKRFDAQCSTTTYANDLIAQRMGVTSRTIDRLRASIRAILAGHDETLPQKKTILNLAMASRPDQQIIEPAFSTWYLRLERLYDDALKERPREYSTTKHYAVLRRGESVHRQQDRQQQEIAAWNV